MLPLKRRVALNVVVAGVDRLLLRSAPKLCNVDRANAAAEVGENMSSALLVAFGGDEAFPVPCGGGGQG